MMAGIVISQAESPADMEEIRALWRDYAHDLGAYLSMWDIRTEMASLPGAFAPPQGVLLIARRAQAPPLEPALGCIGLRPLPGPGDCEVARLYVSAAGRGLGLGQWLGREIICRARAAGYRRIVLEAHDSMESACRIYRSMGFQPIPPYYANPQPGTVYMALDLRP